MGEGGILKLALEKNITMILVQIDAVDHHKIVYLYLAPNVSIFESVALTNRGLTKCVLCIRAWGFSVLS